MLSTKMPEPDTPIEYPSGEIGMAMFHYAAEGQRYDHIADEHGFECQFRELDGDDSDGAEQLWEEYGKGAHDIPGRWHPKVPDEWALAAKYDTEDGPIAMFIRKHEGSAASTKGEG